jgi:hypothetical protein
MRKQNNIRFIVIISVFLLGLSLTVAAQEVKPYEPRQIVLTWQNNPQTTMTITWRTDQKGEKSAVYLCSGKDLDILDCKSQDAETYNFEESVAWLHTVEMTGLNPGQTYWVVVETDGQRSEKFSFRTAPGVSEDLVFVIGADAQHVRTQMHVIREVFQKAAAEDPAFFVYSGDFVNAELSDLEWDLFFDTWHELMITDEGRRIPIIPTIGNHEVVAGYGGTKELAPFYYNRFKLPEPQKYHALQFGPDLTIISLDSNHTSAIDGEQLSWLRRTLDEHKNSTWKVVHYHDGSWWGTESMNAKIRINWVPLFEEYQVSLAHSGHSHSYMRTVPVFGLKPFAVEIDLMIEEGLARAKKDFVPGKNYAPPLQSNLLQLSRGNWQAAGFPSLKAGLKEMIYMLSLFVTQTGEPTRERVYDQVSNTQLHKAFWNPILTAESYDELVDEKKGVVYLVGGGLGAELGSSTRDPRNFWWMEETQAAHHYRRISIDSLKNEMHVVPFFYYPQENRWEEGNTLTRKK